MQITVLGGGSWGTALAHILANKGRKVALLVRREEAAREIMEKRENSRYLPGLPLSPNITATASPAEALQGAEICILAIPCQHMRHVLQELTPLIPEGAIPVCASKGIEIDSLESMRDVVRDVLPRQAASYAILSGPSFAREAVENKPSAVVLGCADAAMAEVLREHLSTSTFRVYSSTDIIGVELGGAVKNVMAIAAGICDGLRLGNNARAALITRGLAEMSRLGAAMGARESTFMGLSGMGDLVLTCTGDLSRNRQVGLRLAAGESIRHICESMLMVAEGVKTTEAICALADKHGIDLPLSRAVYRIIHEGTAPADMVEELMTRTLREE